MERGPWRLPGVAFFCCATIWVPFRTDAKSYPQTDFAPNLRFVPSIQPTQWVTIVLADNVAAFDPKFSILYRADPHARCIDEAKHDPTLATVRNPLNGMITRRIRHFSGYLVSVDEPVIT